MDTEIREKIKKIVKNEMGFQLGIYGECQHTIGLPNETYVMVRPNYSPIDGACVVLVTPTKCKKYTCKYPSAYNEWNLYEADLYEGDNYRDLHELKEALNILVNEDPGFWLN